MLCEVMCYVFRPSYSYSRDCSIIFIHVYWLKIRKLNLLNAYSKVILWRIDESDASNSSVAHQSQSTAEEWDSPTQQLRFSCNATDSPITCLTASDQRGKRLIIDRHAALSVLANYLYFSCVLCRHSRYWSFEWGDIYLARGGRVH